MVDQKIRLVRGKDLFSQFNYVDGEPISFEVFVYHPRRQKPLRFRQEAAIIWTLVDQAESLKELERISLKKAGCSAFFFRTFICQLINMGLLIQKKNHYKV